MSRFYLRMLPLAVAGALLSVVLSAQNATIRGKVSEAETGEPLIAASVLLEQNGEMITGTTTDLDGAYTLQTEPGAYNLIVSYVSYASDTIVIQAEPGGTVFNESILYVEGTFLGEVVVKSQALRTTDLALNLIKQNSVNAIDGISIDLIRRVGDNNLASALTRVTGVSVEGGKYVTVRGLGDRYSKTLLSGGEIPALDPERNTPQLDIFPSNLIDNIVVYKNFTPDLPGSFTGGLVDIRTRSHPEELQLTASASFSYNPTANLRDDFLTYGTGSLDNLGFDDGNRQIPDLVRQIESGFELNGDTIFQIPMVGRSTTDSAEAFLADDVAASFPEYYTVRRKRSGIGQNYQLSFGNQYDLGGRPLGFLIGLSYRKSFNYQEDLSIGRFDLPDSNNVREIRNILGEVTEEEVLWGAIAGLSFKPNDRNKLSFTYMRNQSGINNTRFQSGIDAFDLGPSTDSLRDRTQSFVQRSLDAFQLRGDHLFGETGIKLDWIGSYTLSKDEQPDFRIIQHNSIVREFPRLDENGFPVFDEDGNLIVDSIRVFEIQPSINNLPQRYYRDLDEQNVDVKLNLNIPFGFWGGRKANVKVGGAYTYKDRDFIEKQYNIDLDQGRFNSLDSNFAQTGDLSEAFAPERIGINSITNTGNRTRYNFLMSYFEASNALNSYFADQTIWAGYAMVELPLLRAIKLIGGIRYETTEINLRSGARPDGTFVTGNLNEQDILPAAHLIFKLRENINLRTAYFRTLARPSFREFAPYTNFSFVGDFNLTGNPDLERTLIDNYDVRLEWFPSPGDVISVSGFYKLLKNPIERGFGRFSQTDPDDIFIFNVPEGQSYGIEIEVVKDFGFIAESLRPVQLSANFALIESRVDLDSATAAVSERFGTGTTRPLLGQPDYTLNVELAYVNNLSLGLQASISYNIFGQRLSLVGGSNFNVYEQSRGLLNFSIRKNIGRHFAVQFRARNLLDPEYKQVYKQRPEDVEEFNFETYRLGRSYSLGVSFSL